MGKEADQSGETGQSASKWTIYRKGLVVDAIRSVTRTSHQWRLTDDAGQSAKRTNRQLGPSGEEADESSDAGQLATPTNWRSGSMLRSGQLAKMRQSENRTGPRRSGPIDNAGQSAKKWTNQQRGPMRDEVGQSRKK